MVQEKWTDKVPRQERLESLPKTARNEILAQLLQRYRDTQDSLSGTGPLDPRENRLWGDVVKMSRDVYNEIYNSTMSSTGLSKLTTPPRDPHNLPRWLTDAKMPAVRFTVAGGSLYLPIARKDRDGRGLSLPALRSAGYDLVYLSRFGAAMLLNSDKRSEIVERGILSGNRGQDRILLQHQDPYAWFLGALIRLAWGYWWYTKPEANIRIRVNFPDVFASLTQLHLDDSSFIVQALATEIEE